MKSPPRARRSSSRSFGWTDSSGALSAERILGPDALGQSRQPHARSIEPAAWHVVAGIDEARLDGAAVHADRGRAREAKTGGCRGVCGVDLSDWRPRSNDVDCLLEH